jgi:hypothetical protein
VQLRTDRDCVQDIARFMLAYRRVASMLHAAQGSGQVTAVIMQAVTPQQLRPQLAFLSPDRLLVLRAIPLGAKWP